MTEQEKTDNALFEAALLLRYGSHKFEGSTVEEVIQSLKEPRIYIGDVSKRWSWGMDRECPEYPENWQI